MRSDAQRGCTVGIAQMAAGAVKLTLTRMDDVDGLINRFSDSGPDVAWKLDALLDLELRPDPRVTALWTSVIVDPAEAPPVRVAALRGLRSARLANDERPLVARAIARVAADTGSAATQLRVQAALALGEFLAIEGVLAALGDVASNPTDNIDVRYAAFTSIERAGPIREGAACLRRLAQDEILGPSARHLLIDWR